MSDQQLIDLFPRELVDVLPPEMCRTILELLHYARTARSSEDVRLTLQQIQTLLRLGPSLCGVAQFDQNGQFQTFAKIINLDYPETWLAQYWHRQYAQIDPVIRRLFQASGACQWQAVYAEEQPWSRELQEFIREARRAQLQDGFSASFHAPDKPLVAFLSYAYIGDPPGYITQVLTYIAQVILPGLLKYTQAEGFTVQDRIEQLTFKEMVILSWIREGKSNAEIALITNASERTIRFHVEQILEKLAVTSRTQAVAIAVEYKLPILSA